MIAAIECVYCGCDTGTPHFVDDLDGYTLCVVICDLCGQDQP